MNSLFLLRLLKFSQIIIDPFLFSALLKGAVAGVEHGPFLKSFKCDCVIDVGANRGQFALIARKVFPRAYIYSFEPLAEPVMVFKKVFSKDTRVKLYPYAIGSERTTTFIHVSQEDDSSSLLPITQAQAQLYPGTLEREMRQVKVFPLSQLIPPESISPASLLKLDVQGYELEVLKGCEDIIGKFAHAYIECSFVELYEGQVLAHQIIAWLEVRKFFLTGVYNLSYDREGKAIQGDFFFTRIEENKQ